MTLDPEGGFDARDRRQLERHGLTLAEAERQLRLLRVPPPPPRLERACTVGDGIVRLENPDQEGLLAEAAAAAAGGRCARFVPASGAASRMFQDLLPFRASAAVPSPAELTERSEPGAADLLALLEGVGRLPFAVELERRLAARGGDLARLAREGPVRPILDVLLGEEEMDLASLPKALLPFHRYPDGARTALEEHLVEGASLLRDRQGACRLHLTVSVEHRGRFEEAVEQLRSRLEPALGVRFAISLSVQDPSTDTLAVDGDGRPFRNADGSLLLRPSGHGALLANLQAMGGDVVFLKNVDNVQPDRDKPLTYRWSRLLTGYLVRLQRRAFDWAHRLEAGEAAQEEAGRFVREELGLDPPEGTAELAALLDRPMRVAGMVPNRGEAGGGPFWVRGPDGCLSRQIIESAQVDKSSPQQAALLETSTHFHPVYMACGLRDRNGRPHDLARYVDPDGVILTRKSAGGRALRALERPGLWNGSMARWNTVFVEVPGGVFTPVKTVLALLRPEHQPGAGRSVE